MLTCTNPAPDIHPATQQGASGERPICVAVTACEPQLSSKTPRRGLALPERRRGPLLERMGQVLAEKFARNLKQGD